MKTTVSLFLGLTNMVSVCGQNSTGEKTVVLLPLVKGGVVTAMQKEIVRGFIADELTKVGYETITRDEVDKITADKQFQEKGILSHDQRTKIGKLTSAILICLPTLMAGGKEFYLKVSLLDLKTGEKLKSARMLMSISPNTEIAAGCAKVVQMLVKKDEPKEKVVTVDFAKAKAYYADGVAMFSAQLYEESIDEFTNAINVNPNYKEAYRYRGLVYQKMKKSKEAIADLDKSIAIDPNYSVAYNSLGSIYFTLGKYREAVYNYTKAIGLNPRYGQAYYNRGVAKYMQEDNIAACTDYKKACELKFKKACTNFDEYCK